MTAFYSTAAEVVRRTGLQASDLGIDPDGSGSDEDLQAFLESLLTELADLINRKIGRNYLSLLDEGHIAAIPPGLNGIAADIAADSIRTMVATRQTPIVRVDEFAVTVLRSRVLSDDVVARLRLYGRSGVRSVSMGNR